MMMMTMTNMRLLMTVLFSLFAASAAAAAWTTGSAVSSFGGNVLMLGSSSSSSASSATSSCSYLDMKKGKPNLPPAMRGDYKNRQKMAEMRKQMEAAQTPGTDGLPIFQLFVRTKRANVWYPCGSFKGDDRSAALAKSWSDGGILAGISKKQMDGGIAGSLYKDLNRLKESIVRTYPQLKKSRDEIEFGYKLAFIGLSEEKAKEIFVVEPKEQKGVFDGIRNMFSSSESS
jgi:Family of unknown function (DUF6523)